MTLNIVDYTLLHCRLSLLINAKDGGGNAMFISDMATYNDLDLG